MIAPYRRFCVANTIPVLHHFFMYDDKLTVTNFLPAPAGLEDEAGVEVITRAAFDAIAQSHILSPGGRHIVVAGAFGNRVIPGEFLDPRLGGERFIHGTSVCLNPALLGPGEWVDHSSILFGMQVTGELTIPFSRWLDSHGSKGDVLRTIGVRGVFALAHLAIPFATTKLSECSLSVAVSSVYPFPVGNITFDAEVPYEVAHQGIEPFLPQLRLTVPASVAPGGLTEVGVEVVDAQGVLISDADALVYLEAVDGYLPHSRCPITNGVGSFKVMALGLSSGEELRIKTGWRQFSGVADAVIPVA